MSDSVMSKRRGIAPPLSTAVMNRKPKKRKAPPEKSASRHALPVRIDELGNTFGHGWTQPHRADQGNNWWGE